MDALNAGDVNRRGARSVAWLFALAARHSGGIGHPFHRADTRPVGLNDREYMRDVPEYRRLTGRGGGGSAAAGSGAGEPPRPRMTSRDYLSRPRPVRAPRPAWTRTAASRPWAWMLLGVIATLAVIAEWPRQHASGLPPAIPIQAPAQQAAKPEGLISGVRVLQYGSTVTVTGTSEPVAGYVRVLGSWNSGAWQTFAVSAANGASYRVEIPLNETGTLRLRVVQPDGSASVGTYQVS